MTSAILPSGVTFLGAYSFYHCSALQSITLPSSLTSINNYTFYNCTSLASVTIPSGVTSIGNNAFSNCNALTSITIPSAVTSIGNYAFYNCTGLTSITVEATTPPTLGTNVFQNVPTTIPVYVPCDAIGAYLNYNNTSSPWGGFSNIVGIGCEYTQELTANWNWWAPDMAVSATELMDAINAGSISGDILINSQSEGFARRTNGTWGGTLTSVVPGRMYKVWSANGGSFTYGGTKPGNVTVTIVEGYNWFGYTGATAAIATALGDFQPADGDTITDEDSHTATYNGGWSGTLSTLVNGKGYVYRSNDATTKTITF